MATFSEIVEQINDSIKSQLDSCELNLEITTDARFNLGGDLYYYYRSFFNADLPNLIKITAVKIRVTEEMIYENQNGSISDSVIQFHLKWEVL